MDSLIAALLLVLIAALISFILPKKRGVGNSQQKLRRKPKPTNPTEETFNSFIDGQLAVKDPSLLAHPDKLQPTGTPKPTQKRRNPSHSLILLILPLTEHIKIFDTHMQRSRA